MRKSVITPIAAGVLLALSGVAQAVTKTDSFVVSATVSKNCVIDAPDLNLGTFDGTNNLAASSTISVKCTSGTTYDVDLSTGSSGTYANRTLVLGSDTLIYNLYTTNSYTTVWGDNTGGSGRPATGTGAGMSTNQTLTVYGRLLAADNTGPVAAGSYSDTIVATITY
jgi:spore coat protein U domain-containing protein, fimbrial subunit CupE1/2/3/6